MAEIAWNELIQGVVLLIVGGLLTAGGSYLGDRRHSKRERENREIERAQVFEDAAREHLHRVYMLCENLIDRTDLTEEDLDDFAYDDDVAEIRRLSGLLPGEVLRARVMDGVFILSQWNDFRGYPQRADNEGAEFYHIVNAIRETVASRLRGDAAAGDEVKRIDDRMAWYDEQPW